MARVNLEFGAFTVFPADAIWIFSPLIPKRYSVRFILGVRTSCSVHCGIEQLSFVAFLWILPCLVQELDNKDLCHSPGVNFSSLFRPWSFLWNALKPCLMCFVLSLRIKVILSLFFLKAISVVISNTSLKINTIKWRPATKCSGFAAWFFFSSQTLKQLSRFKCFLIREMWIGLYYSNTSTEHYSSVCTKR